MKSIENNINDLKNRSTDTKPVFFDLNINDDINSLNKLLASGSIQSVSDDFNEQLRELFAIKNPSIVYTPDFNKKFDDYCSTRLSEKPLYKQGLWVFYPWISKLVHILNEKDFFTVRTARNKNLINVEEQDRFYNAKVGIGGMSVGSSVAFAMTLQGGPKHLKLADFDKLALSNTNRVLSGIENLGKLKVEMAAQFMYQINPYMEIELYSEGLTKDNIENFCKDLDVVIDELDNLSVKYLIREQAKKYKIPVVMAADNGDNAVVDIERYDLDPDMPFFHNRMGKVSFETLANLDKFGIGKMITKHVGPENVTERMQQSLLEMGKTIVSWPQLGGAALINGAAVAYCVRKILNQQPLETNRSLLNVDSMLISDYNKKEQVLKRQQISDNFKKIFGL